MKASLKKDEAYISSLQSEQPPSRETSREIDSSKRQYQRMATEVDELANQYQDFDPGAPESEGYWSVEAAPSNAARSYSTYVAYLKRGAYIFILESTEELTKTVTKQSHAIQMRALLAKFITRKPNEIPTERGVCIPGGFIEDDGTTRTDMKQTLRFPDAPRSLICDPHGQRACARNQVDTD